MLPHRQAGKCASVLLGTALAGGQVNKMQEVKMVREYREKIAK